MANVVSGEGAEVDVVALKASSDERESEFEIATMAMQAVNTEALRGASRWTRQREKCCSLATRAGVVYCDLLAVGRGLQTDA